MVQPRTLADHIAEVRAGLVCARCGKYVGSLAIERYRPPPYPVAIDGITADEEAEALIAFELHMIGRVRAGNFTIAHPQRGGRCISVREWLARDHDDGEGDHDEADATGEGS